MSWFVICYLTLTHLVIIYVGRALITAVLIRFALDLLMWCYWTITWAIETAWIF